MRNNGPISSSWRRRREHINISFIRRIDGSAFRLLLMEQARNKAAEVSSFILYSSKESRTCGMGDTVSEVEHVMGEWRSDACSSEQLFGREARCSQAVSEMRAVC